MLSGADNSLKSCLVNFKSFKDFAIFPKIKISIETEKFLRVNCFNTW